MKNSHILRSLLLTSTLAMVAGAHARWTFTEVSIQGTRFTGSTPDGQYLCGFSDAGQFRWSLAIGLELIPEALNSGNNSLSHDGSKMAIQALDTSDNKRKAAIYDFNTSTITFVPIPAGFSATGVDSTISSPYGISGDGTKLATSVYDGGNKLKPVLFNATNNSVTAWATFGTSHARPNTLSNDGTTMVGYDTNPNTRRVSIWKNGVQVHFDPTNGSEAFGTTPNGDKSFGTFLGTPATWSSAFSVTQLPTIGTRTRGGCIGATSEGGLIAGYLEPPANPNQRQATLWESGTPIFLVDWLLARGLTVPNFNFVTATGITPDGNTIYGWGTSVTSLFAGFVLKNSQATVTGTVDLGDFDFESGEPVTFVVHDGSISETVTATLGVGGAYSFKTSLDGPVSISCKGATWLRKLETGITLVAEQSNAGPNFTLLNGDCDGNNVITTDDYLILSDSFDLSLGDAGYDARADLNGDDVVTTDDYLALSNNFDLEGDPEF